MTRRGLLAAWLSLLVLGGVQVPTAAADFTLPAGSATHFRLSGSHGYRIDVLGWGGEAVQLRAAKAGASALYVVPTKRGGYGMHVQLPGVGSLSVGFRRNGHRHRLDLWPQCDGPPPVVHGGHVHGRIHFRGERGYTRVNAHHAAAQVLTWQRQSCDLSAGVPFLGRPRERAAELLAFKVLTGIGFDAVRFKRRAQRLPGRVIFKAEASDRRGPMYIERYAVAIAGPTSLRMPEPKTQPEHLLVEPPPPFAGTASFTRSSESTFSWAGSLRARLPGLAQPAPLTGPRFDVFYCAFRGCAYDPAEEEIGRSRRLAALSLLHRALLAPSR
jgi:hypothetical protein